MPDFGDTQHPEVVGGSTSVFGEPEERQRPVLCHDAVDLVVVRSGRTKTHHVPVAGDLSFGYRDHR